MPVVIVAEKEIKEGNLSASVKDFLSLLLELSKSNLSILKEIVEIDTTNNRGVKIILRGRKTVCTIGPTKKNFYKLNYSIGLFDMKKMYPDTLEIIDRIGIIK